MAKIKDKKGLRYGKLLVLSKKEKNVNGRVHWLCQCDCGNTCTVRGSHLGTGTNSCGCLVIGGKKLDLTGLRYGRLVVLREAALRNTQNTIRWLCQCDCGNTHIANRSDLRSGHVKSCGCWKKLHPSHKTHGKSRTRIYNIWAGMNRRCSDINHIKSKKNYIDKGIKVCNEWKNSVEVFTAWAEKNGYGDNLSLDRRNTDGNYHPNNCRWVSLTIQSRNRRKAENTSSKYIGVCYDIARKKYRAGVTVANKCVFSKRYTAEIEAAKARDNYIKNNKLEGYKLNF